MKFISPLTGPLSSRALIIFAKIPRPGCVKTRLSPPLTQEEAAKLYNCMLQDSVAMALSLSGVTPFIFFQNDPDAAEYFATTFPAILSLPQAGDDLGERMKNAFAEIFSRSFAQVAIIGTDSPDLPPAYIFETFDLLEDEHTDLVFGPAEDGGYYLVGLKRVREELFRGLPWSSSGLLSDSLKRAKDAALVVSLLPVWYDLDTGADLKRPGLLDEKSRAIKTRKFLISGHRPDIRPPSDS